MKRTKRLIRVRELDFEGTFEQLADEMNVDENSIKTSYYSYGKYNRMPIELIGFVDVAETFTVMDGDKILCSGTMEEIGKQLGYTEKYLFNCHRERKLIRKRYRIKSNKEKKEIKYYD